MLTKKYGEPEVCIEEFQTKIMQNNDNSKMHEVRMNRCKYVTGYTTEKGNIELQIKGSLMDGCYVTLIYLYAGEDLPEIEIEKITPKDAKILKDIVMSFDESEKLYQSILKRYGVKSFKGLTVKQRIEILEGLNQMSRNREAQNGNKIHDTGKTEGQTATSNMSN